MGIWWAVSNIRPRSGEQVNLVKVGIHFRVWILSLVLLCSHAYRPCKLLLDTTADDAAHFAVKATAVRVAGLQRGDLGCVSDLSLAAAGVGEGEDGAIT